nr:Chain E, Peptide from Rho guanine nucleotide exchange factor [Entamoeba histolytica]
KVAPPIPHR